MVDLVNVLVQRSPMQSAVRPVVPGIFEDKENGDLISHREDGGEWYSCSEATILSHRMEKPAEA